MNEEILNRIKHDFELFSRQYFGLKLNKQQIIFYNKLNKLMKDRDILISKNRLPRKLKKKNKSRGILSYNLTCIMPPPRTISVTLDV